MRQVWLRAVRRVERALSLSLSLCPCSLRAPSVSGLALLEHSAQHAHSIAPRTPLHDFYTLYTTATLLLHFCGYTLFLYTALPLHYYYCYTTL